MSHAYIYILRLTIIIRAIFHKVINIVQPNFPYPLFIFIQFGITSDFIPARIIMRIKSYIIVFWSITT